MVDQATDRIALLRRLADRGRAGELGADGVQLSACLDFYFEHARSGVTIDEAMGLKVKPGGRPWWVRDAQDRCAAALGEALQRFCRGDLSTLVTELRSYDRARWKRDAQLSEMPLAYARTMRELLYRAFRENESVAPGRMPMSGKQLRRILLSHCDSGETPGHESPPIRVPASEATSAQQPRRRNDATAETNSLTFERRRRAGRR
jgi:hypothetical protein